MVAALVALALAAGCGSDEEDQATSAGAKNGTEQNAAAASGGIAAAQAQVDKFTELQPPEEIPPLSGKPASDVTVSWVGCTVPTCAVDQPAKAASALGWKLNLRTYDIGKGPADLVRAMTAAVQDKPDYIGVLSIFPTAVYQKLLDQAREAGIGVVAVTGEGGPQFAGCLACAPEQEGIGRLLVDIALADAGEKTGILYLNSANNLPLVQSAEGARAEVEKNGEGSSFDVLELEFAAEPAAKAATVSNYLQRHPDVQYVLGATSELVKGLPQQLASTGLGDRVKVITATPSPAEQEAIASGQMLGGVAAENTVSMWRAIDLMARLSLDEEIPDDLARPEGWFQILTKENANQVELSPPDFEQTFMTAWQVG